VSVVANVAINVDSRGAVGKLRDVQNQAQATERAFGGLGAAVGKLAAAFGGIQTARFVFAKTAEIESQTRSLQVLTGSAQKAKQIVEELQQLGAVTPFTSTELIDAAKRLQAFGVEANNVVETTRRLADASGATGAELQGLVTAYGQVQAKGRLQGEELLQFQERGIALQEELRKMYGMTGEEFQKALSKGQVSAKAVEVALQRLTSAGGKYANGAIAQSDTLNGKLSTLQDGVDALARRIGQVLTPALKAIFNQAIAVVDAINAALAAGRGGGLTRNVAGARQFLNIGATSQAVDNIAKGISQVGSQKNKTGINQNLQALQQYQRLLQSVGPSDPNANRAVQLQGVILQKINENIAAQKRLQTGTQQTNKLFTVPPLAAATGGAKGGGATKGKSDAEKLAEELKRSLEEGRQLSVEFSRQIMLLSTTSEIEKKRLQIVFEYQDNQKKVLALKNLDQRNAAQLLIEDIKRRENRELDLEIIKDGLSAFERIAGLDFSNTEKLGARAFGQGGGGGFRTDISLLSADKATQKYDEMRNRLKELTDPINAATTGAQAISGAFGSAFQSIISGAQSTEEALAGVFKNIGESFINMATEILAQMMMMFIFKQLLGLFGGGGGGGGLFSGAGPVSGASVFGSGQAGFNPSAFGGMKLFADGGFVTGPTSAVVGEGGESEYIIPASKMRSAMSRYAAGARGSAVIPAGDDTSSGGGTATMAPAAIDVRYTVERINSVDYVTADQFRAGMAQAAQQGATQGEQRTLRRLQQSRATRSRLGMN
jgi:tape measure domain-containing protein